MHYTCVCSVLCVVLVVFLSLQSTESMMQKTALISLSLSHTHTAHSIYLRLRGALPSFKFSHLFHNNNISFPFARAYLFHFAHSIYTNKYDGFDGYSFRICIQFAWHIFFFFVAFVFVVVDVVVHANFFGRHFANRYSLFSHYSFQFFDWRLHFNGGHRHDSLLMHTEVRLNWRVSCKHHP